VRTRRKGGWFLLLLEVGHPYHRAENRGVAINNSKSFELGTKWAGRSF